MAAGGPGDEAERLVARASSTYIFKERETEACLRGASEVAAEVAG